LVNKLRKYMASAGGPIVLAQIENELGSSADRFQYANWAANFALSLDIGVPWTMCSQGNIPTVINTCNGFYCDGFPPDLRSKYPNQPALWVEDWPGLSQQWGQAVPHRPVQDILFAMARWFRMGTSHHNYYMWHGGTTFGRWTGANGGYILTSYDFDVALNEYGYPHNPKFTRLSEFHWVLIKYKDYLLNYDPVIKSVNPDCDVSIFGKDSNNALVFLSNTAYPTRSHNVTWNGKTYSLNPWSVVLVSPDNQEVFDTSDIGLVTSPLKTPGQAVLVKVTGTFRESATNTSKASTKANRLLEQLSITKDTTDYLWYRQTVNFQGSATLKIDKLWDMVHVFIDGAYIGSSGFMASSVELQVPDSIRGNKELQILCVVVGLMNIGGGMETLTKGLLGDVYLNNAKLTNGEWIHSPSILGESWGIYTPQNVSRVNWASKNSGVNQALTWFRGTVDMPEVALLKAANPGYHPYAIDMTGMNKGMVFVNGRMLGRYWLIAARDTCTPSCSYAQPFHDAECKTGCGEPSQRYYHVPADWLKPKDNLVVFFEEIGGNPSQVQLVEFDM